MIASLPMYDLAEARSATDAFWAALARELGVSLPLTRQDDWMEVWRAPDLLFSQTCGYPFTHAFKGRLTYVATPHYAADGCDGPLYSSILFARQAAPLEDFRGCVAAFNNRDSMSGMLALQVVFAPLARDGGFFARSVETGGHLASLAAVQSGAADVCAIDCVTVALALIYRPAALAGLVEVGRSPQVPGLPFVTGRGDVERLRAALAAVFARPDVAGAREALLLSGFSVLAVEDYEVIPQRERDMQALGGLRLF